MSDKAGKESQYVISRTNLDSDPPTRSDRDSGRDTTYSPAGLYRVIK